MITSGLVITLSTEATLATQAIAKVSARPEFTPGERNDRWLPVAMEARDDAESRGLHDWLQSLPGVEYVDVVSVNFEEPDREPSRLAAGDLHDAPQNLRAGPSIRAAATGDRSRSGTAVQAPASRPMVEIKAPHEGRPFPQVNHEH